MSSVTTPLMGIFRDQVIAPQINPNNQAQINNNFRDPNKNEVTSKESQANPSSRNIVKKIFYEGFKIGITIGASIIASAFLGPLGGMIIGGLVSAAFSVYEQNKEKGQINLQRVVLEFGLGFVSIGVGKVITKLLGGIFKKALAMPILNTAVNSGFQGGFTGASLTAYDTFVQTGKIDGVAVAQSFVIGGITGAAMGTVIRRMSPARTHEEEKLHQVLKSIKKTPFDSQANSEKFKGYFEMKYGEIPSRVTKAIKWHNLINAEIKQIRRTLEMQGIGCGFTIMPLDKCRDDINKRLVSLADEKIAKLIKRVLDGKIKEADLVLNSKLRRELKACSKVIRKFPYLPAKLDIESRLVMDLIIYSRPKFLQPQTNLNISMLRKEKTASNLFCEGVKDGIRALPEKARGLLKETNCKVYVLRSQNRAEAVQMQKVVMSEPLVTSRILFGDQSNQAKLTTIHECGHVLDASIVFYRPLRQLRKAVSLEEYVNVVRKFRDKIASQAQRKEFRGVFSSRSKFIQAHADDIKLMPLERQRELNYFISGGRKTDPIVRTNTGRCEAFAETITLLLGGHSRITRNDFPNTIALVERMLKKSF